MYHRPEFPITRGQRVSLEKVRVAKNLRRNMTCSESLLWKRLRRGQLGGFHFRRQQIIAGFIADFYCVTTRLVIEVDGPVHETQADSDRHRDEALAAMGIFTLRFTNAEVVGDIESVLQRINATCNART
jgi:very-short-patch-repair endonuclease